MFGGEIIGHRDLYEISKIYNNLSKDGCDALHSLKDDPAIIIKGADKGSGVVVCGREDYLKEAYKQLDDGEVYEQVPNDPNVLINTIMIASKKMRLRGDLSSDTLNYFLVKDSKYPNMLDSILYQKCINVYMKFSVDQLLQTAAFTPKMCFVFWTTIWNQLLRGLNIMLSTLIIF